MDWIEVPEAKRKDLMKKLTRIKDMETLKNQGLAVYLTKRIPYRCLIITEEYLIRQKITSFRVNYIYSLDKVFADEIMELVEKQKKQDEWEEILKYAREKVY